ncbi:NAD(+)/NADH kinase [candidate division WOR-3 bacterium]|nr:NAD(+)/NADH kinase [candidate division WOR-3 bacterium]
MHIGIIANPEKKLVYSIVPELIQWLLQNRQQVFIGEAIQPVNQQISLGEKCPKATVCKLEELPRLCDVIFAIGGDGTLLKTARVVGSSGVPILGINLGGLGFLTEVALDTLYPALAKLLKSDYKIESRMVLETSVRDCKFYSLNDTVITGTGAGRMLQFMIYINGSYVSEFSSDGLIISTPTGSTAYSLAALGPILHPEVEAIVLNLICPHTLGARPIVMSNDSIIEVECKSSNTALVIDGQESVPLKQGEKVVFRKADYKIKLIKSSARDFYEILRTKLKWGGGKER